MQGKEPETQYHEREFQRTTLANAITSEQLIQIQTSWAKSYGVPASLVKLTFDTLPPDDPDVSTHVNMEIWIKGEFVTHGDGYQTNQGKEWRRVYRLKIMPPEKVQRDARSRQASLMAHTPLQTIALNTGPKRLRVPAVPADQALK
jgi:hypothetical protein